MKYARIVSCVFCPDNEVKQNNIPKKKAIEPLFIENVVLLFIRYIFEYCVKVPLISRSQKRFVKTIQNVYDITNFCTNDGFMIYASR